MGNQFLIPCQGIIYQMKSTRYTVKIQLQKQPFVYVTTLALAICFASMIQIPNTAHAEEPATIYQLSRECNVFLECGLGSEQPLFYQAGSGEMQNADMQLHVAASFFNMRRDCPTSGKVSFSSTFTCHDVNGNGQMVNASLTAGGLLKQGMNSYVAQLEHDVTQETYCYPEISATLTLENGQTVFSDCQELSKPANSIQFLNPDRFLIHATTLESTPDLPAKSSTPQTIALNLSSDYLDALPQPTPYTLEHFFAQGNLQKTSTFKTYAVSSSPCDYSLDEITACSSDQVPVCGCDNAVWSGVCEATQAGVGIRSSSPEHPQCVLGKATSSGGVTMQGWSHQPVVFQGDSFCYNANEPLMEMTEPLDKNSARELLIRYQPSALVPSYMTFLQGQISLDMEEPHHFSTILFHDPNALPSQCLPASYRLHSCASTNPCCSPDGIDADCNPHDARLAFCQNNNDRDCDGFPDAEDPGSVINTDIDGDDLSDWLELRHGLDPLNHDSDGDGLSDHEEWFGGQSDPWAYDTDNDLVPDRLDSAPRMADQDRDGIPDGDDPYPRDPDHDRDGLLDGEDFDPNNPDVDGDTLLDGLEVLIGSDMRDASDPEQIPVDSDGDGLTDDMEIHFGSDPMIVDTDGDGLSDFEERFALSDPTLVDSDNDGLNDYDEYRVYFTDAGSRSSDNDGISDFEELFYYNTDPLLTDTDGDGVSDFDELFTTRTSPHRRDTDGGGVEDSVELSMRGRLLDASDDFAQQFAHYSYQRPVEGYFYYGEGQPNITVSSSLEYDEGTPLSVLSHDMMELPHHVLGFDTRFSLGNYVNVHNILHITADEFDLEHSVLFTKNATDDPNTMHLVFREQVVPFRDLRVNVTTRISYTGSYTLPSDFRPIYFTVDADAVDAQGAEKSITLELRGDTPLTPQKYELQTIIHAEVLEQGVLTFEEICGNELDDDRNGLTDCWDREACASECTTTEDCFDEIDNNYNGLADLDDPECAQYIPSPEVCWDFYDNDLDGFIDGDDFDCQESHNCNDGIDNDGNGLIDAEDILSCAAEICDDGVDNDGDGFADCVDPKCAQDFFCCDYDESCGGEICTDGFDNDFDDLVDCYDDDCAAVPVCVTPGLPPKRSLRDRLTGGCGCNSLNTTSQSTPLNIPHEGLVILTLGLLVGLRRTGKVKVRSCTSQPSNKESDDKFFV